MKIKIIKETKNWLVIEKPAGLVVQEGPEHETETLDKMGDWFLVHRLDKDTSGLLLLAKNETTRDFLQNQFKNRTIEKKYLALVAGKLEPKKGEIKLPILRHPRHRQQMTISYLEKGKPAITQYQVIKYFPHTTLLEVKPLTGRMHQIRVHLKYLGFPIIGDQTYNNKLSKKLSRVYGLSHQFLHASYLKFRTPDGTTIELKSELPEDLQNVLEKVK